MVKNRNIWVLKNWKFYSEKSKRSKNICRFHAVFPQTLVKLMKMSSEDHICMQVVEMHHLSSSGEDLGRNKVWRAREGNWKQENETFFEFETTLKPIE